MMRLATALAFALIAMPLMAMGAAQDHEPWKFASSVRLEEGDMKVHLLKGLEDL